MQSEVTAIGLVSLREEHGTVRTDEVVIPDNAVSLPPVDGGKDAWLFLAASFVVEVMTWGFAYTFGILQDYFDQNDLLHGNANIPTVGTTQIGIMHMLLPVIFASLLYWPSILRWSTPVGLALMCVALAASSFAQTSADLIGTLGVMYGFGGSLAFGVCFMFLQDWFVKRRNIAYATVFAGTGLAGVVIPFFMATALDRFGFRTLMRAWSIALFLLTAPLLHFIKPRQPPSSRPVNLHFLRSPSFNIFQICNVIQGVGFFLPSVYLPIYAQQQLGSSHHLATLTLVILNAAGVAGRLSVGWLIDHLDVTSCLLICGAGSAAAIFLCWGLSTHIAVLYVFCCLYGFFSGGVTSAWPGIMGHTTREVASADAGMVFGFLALGRGIGNFVSGPLSEALLRGRPWEGGKGLGYATGYGPLIVFTGVSALVGGFSFVGRFGRGLL